MSDFEPIVLDPDDPAFAEPIYACGAITLSESARSYLTSVGITDQSTWSAFHLDQVDEETWERLGFTVRRRSFGNGISIPTFDPRQPGYVVGVVRLTPGQNKHAFASAPAGLAGRVDLGPADRIIIADNPLLAMRLHQAGVPGVVLAEEPAVLPALLDWLDGRPLVVVGYKPAGISAIRAALGRHAERAVPLVVAADLACSTAESLAVLGIARDALRGAVPRPPITPLLLRDLHAFAVGRLGHSDARATLEALDLADPDLVRAWQIGYLPSDFRQALAPEQRRALEGHLHAGAVIIPAMDATGAVVDLACAQAPPGRLSPTLWDAPRGLVGSVVASAFGRVTVTDNLRQAGRWFSAGDQAVVWLRGLPDATANAPRLAAAGVRSASVRSRRDGGAIAEALASAGIAIESTEPAITADPVEPPRSQAMTTAADAPPASAPPPPSAAARGPALVLVRHDTSREEAVFGFGELTITAQLPWGDETTLRLVLGRHDRRCADRIDVAQPAQRRRLAASAALRLDLPPAEVETALAGLLSHLRAVVEANQAAPVSLVATLMTDAEQSESLADLRSADLRGRVLSWLAALGMPGDDDGALLLFLAALSRKSDDPVWMALITSTPGAAHPIDVIAEAAPPEEVVAASRLTDHALVNTDPGALRHRLLVLHDAERVTPAVGTALRILRRRGALAGTKVERDPVRGEVRTTIIETRGPVAVLTTTTGQVDERLRPCLVEVPADESQPQVERLLAAERTRRADPRRAADARSQALRRLRNLQRLVEPRPVVMPFAGEVAAPAFGPHAQRDQAALLALVSAHALLHQHQRLSDQGAVVATRTDLAAARRLAARWSGAGTGANGLGPHAARLLTAIRAAGVASVTIDQVETALLPGWSRHALRTGLAELVAVDHLASPRVGRGHRRVYHVVAAGAQAEADGDAFDASATPLRYDRSERKVCELAEVGDGEKHTLTHDRKSG
jgi:hypothetical protein